MRKFRIAALQGPMDRIAAPVTMEKNVAWTIERIRGLAAYGVDIVCLAEIFHTFGTDLKAREDAEKVPGPLTRRMAGLARELKMAIICPLHERRGGKIYNTAVVINKAGKIVGRYDKIHPTEDELADGIVPGRLEPTVMTLEGVKIGCQICFDANWPEDWVNQKKAGARLIFFCSAFSAGELIKSYATLLNVPVVAATVCRDCRIYDRTGRQIAHQTPYFDYAMADVLIDQPLFHLDYQFDRLEKIRRDHPDISTEVFDGEGRWAISGEEKAVQKMIDRYELQDIDTYLTRSGKKQAAVRKKK